MSESDPEIELVDYLNVLWKRRWLILIPTVALIVAAGIVSFRLPPKWDVDVIIQPGKFFVRTETGSFNEVMVTDPKQLAGQINQGSYNRLIGADLNLDPRRFPSPRAEQLRDTNLLRVVLRTGETEMAKAILASLFQHLKGELDQKIDVQIKFMATQIAARENDIKSQELDIQDRNIEIDRARQEIGAARNKLKISEDRSRTLVEEMKEAKARIDAIENQQKTILAEKTGGVEALGLLLFSNEIQQTFQYYNTLDGSLSAEKEKQEDLRLTVLMKEQAIRGLKTLIERIQRKIVGLRSDIELLAQKNQLIDYAQIVKEPTVSLKPAWPRKKRIIGLAGVLGFAILSLGVLLQDYVRRKNALKANR